ncbi:MAG: hypothetical protein QM696_03160 [Steroidobacteraceae bacterium]
MAEVAVIDSGGANLASLLHALQRLGARAEVTTDLARIEAATHVLLPGVGAAFDAMERLEQAGLRGASRRSGSRCWASASACSCCSRVRMRRRPASLQRAAWACCRVMCRACTPMPIIPCRTWAGTHLELLRPDPLFAGFGAADYVYFVHSYAASVDEATLAVTDYGAPGAGRRAARQFPWRAIPSRALGQGRRAAACEFPGN